MLKVELGLDIEDSPIAFQLDNDPRGKLNGTSPLGGALFYDVTDSVVEATTRRGKNQSLGNYDSGSARITLNNEDRMYDPQNPNAPLAAGLVPRREVRITKDSQPLFFGYIDDIDLSYDLSGKSDVQINCVDGFSVLANAIIQTEEATVEEKSGTRAGKLLALPDVDWDTDYQDIETGARDVIADPITVGTSALAYLQELAESEGGQLFIDGSGVLQFKASNTTPLAVDLYLTDDLTVASTYKAGFNNIAVSYGTELLYNLITVSNGTDTATAEDTLSQALYGIRPLNTTGLLTTTPSLQSIANNLLALYKNPRYRFEQVSVRINNLDATTQGVVLGLELGDLVTIKFTPNNVPPAIEQACRIVGISTTNNLNYDDVVFDLEPYSVAAGVFVLDSAADGILDEDLLA